MIKIRTKKKKILRYLTGENKCDLTLTGVLCIIFLSDRVLLLIFKKVTKSINLNYKTLADKKCLINSPACLQK